MRTALRVAIVVAILSSLSCGSIEEHREFVSIDRSAIASVYYIRFGMTESLTAVTMRSSDRGFTRWWNDEVLVINGTYEIELHWEDDALVVTCPKCEPWSVEVKEERWRRFGVRYPDFGTEAGENPLGLK